MSTEPLPCHDLRRWNAMARQTFGDIEVHAPPGRFSAAMASREVAALRLVDVWSTPARVHGGTVRRAGWYLLFNRGGACMLRQRGRSVPSDMSVRHASDIDLFTDEALADPYPLYGTLRDLGPVAWLRRYDVWFIARYDSVRAAPGDCQTWSSAAGVGLNPIINEAWKSALICVDPPLHTHMRTLITDRFGPRQLEGVQQAIVLRAERLAECIAAQRDFEAVADVAHDLPIGVIMDLIGWPEEVRGSLLDLAAGSFDACGPDNPRMRAALPRLEAMMEFIADTYDRGRLAEGGFGWTVADAARRDPARSRHRHAGRLCRRGLRHHDRCHRQRAVPLCREPRAVGRLRAEPALLPAAFNEKLLEQRLQRAARRLREPGYAQERISTVAQPGLGDLSHFFRTDAAGANAVVPVRIRWVASRWSGMSSGVLLQGHSTDCGRTSARPSRRWPGAPAAVQRSTERPGFHAPASAALLAVSQSAKRWGAWPVIRR